MIVYMILNAVNGKKYVGSTIDLKSRVRRHLSCCDKSRLTKDILAYGKEKFFVSELSKHTDFEKMRVAEKLAIQDFDCIANGYNSIVSSQGKKPRKFGEKIRKVRLGKKLSHETKERISVAKTGVNIWPNGRPSEHMQAAIASSVKKRSQAVKCSNGNTYKSAAEAARILGLSKSGVTSVCNGKRNSCNGLLFEKVHK